MKQYLNLLLFVLLAVLMISVSALISENAKNEKEIERISQNISVANDSVRYYKDRAGEYVATIGALIYTVGEYERFMAKDKETINYMKIKLKNALNTTNVETKTEVVFKEKLIYKPDSTVCFEFSDSFTSIDACINKDSIAGIFKNREELFLVVHTKKTKRFLWWRYGTKITDISAKSENPNTTISKIQYTIIK